MAPRAGPGRTAAGERRVRGSRALERRVVDRLTHGSLHEVLALLNARTRFRFTGAYRIELPTLHNLALFDRENPGVHRGGGDSPLAQSYCALVYDGGAPAVVGGGSRGGRAGVAAPAGILSYVGVPLRDGGGRVIGTLCHFDSRPRLLAASELAVLVHLAPHLAPHVVRA